MKNWIITGQALLSQRQGSILSAAFIVMVLVAASRIFGLIRQRVLAHYFSVEDLAIYFAAFRLPETLFEVLVAGTLTSAFIPVFTTLLSGGERRRAWYVAGITQTTLFVIFAFFSLFILIFARPLIAFLAPGFPIPQQETTALLTRFLLLAQGFFLLSFFMSGTQEAFGRFFVPAMAPLFYNLGIIGGSALLSGMGIWGAAIGALLGAALHFAFQIPFARSLGFHFVPKIDLKNSDFRKILTLVSPRIIELVALQFAKGVELFLSTTISIASYTYFIFANTLQLFPVALFGYSFAKAALPTLSAHAARRDSEAFSRTFAFTVGQILFFIVPITVFFVVLRIPLVRLAFGAQRFTWEATVQTGYALSAFAAGIAAQAILAVLTRSFYALQDTKTPLLTTLLTIAANIFLAFFFVKELGWGVWGIAASFSIALLFQAAILLFLLDRRIKIITSQLIVDIGKILFASGVAGLVMYFLLKVLDLAVWDKRLSFLGEFGLALPTGFERFVVDTRYTVNLIFLTALVLTVGIFIYFLIGVVLRIREVEILARWAGKILSQKVQIAPGETHEPELPAPLPPGG